MIDLCFWTILRNLNQDLKFCKKNVNHLETKMSKILKKIVKILKKKRLNFEKMAKILKKMAKILNKNVRTYYCPGQFSADNPR